MLGQVSDLDIRLLRIFVTIVECGGFAPATARLNISESTISSNMHDLEQRLGMRLCDRGRRGFRLTADGSVVYEAAKKLFANLDTFRNEVVALRQKMSGAVQVGLPDCMVTNPDARFHAAFERYYSRENDVRLVLHILSPRDLERGVLEGRIQIAVAPRHRRIAGLEFTPLFDEENLLFCGRGHPFFDRPDGSLTRTEVAEAGCIERGYWSGFDEPLFGSIPHRATVFDVEAAAVLILSGRFLGFLPTHYARGWVDQGVMRAVMPDDLRFESRFGIVTRKGEKHGLVVQTLIDDLLAVHGVGDAGGRSKPKPRTVRSRPA
jgi:DNA-binding transcriptional LysR family regulator